MTESLSIFYSAGRLFSNSQKAFTLENEKKLGERKDNQIIYSSFEAAYLAEVKGASILEGSKKISFQNFMNKVQKRDKDFEVRYAVFKDLRKKGYIVKTGLKFGTDFRVYKKSASHAQWLAIPVSDSSKANWRDFSARNRIAHSTGKKLLMAIVDSEEDISYYEVGWVKP